MSPRIRWILPLTTALLGAVVFGCWLRMSGTSSSSLPPPATSYELPAASQLRATNPQPIDAARFLDRPEFRRVWSSAKAKTVSGNIIAGTVNHHVLASDLLANFFLTLAVNRPDATRIVILSPDHFYAGRSQISTHTRPYQTPDGILDIDTKAVRTLVDNRDAVLENGSMYEVEHGIGALTPFIKKTMPHVRIIPISIKGNADLEASKKLAAAIEKLDDGKTIFIISADMSHYLSKKTALKNDLETKQWLQEKNESTMSKAKDTHTDSGRQFVTLFDFLNTQYPKAKFQLLDQGISSSYGGDDQNTTSYLNGVWTKN